MESKLFYHRSDDDMLKRKIYLTPLERKAIRAAKNVTLDGRLSNDTETPIKEENCLVKQRKNNAYRRLKMKKSEERTRNYSSTPVKMRPPKFSWAPKSLNGRFLKDKWINKLPPLALPRLHDLYTKQHNASFPDNMCQSKKVEFEGEEAKSSSFSVGPEIDEISCSPPAKVRKVDGCESDILSEASEVQNKFPDEQNQKEVSMFYPIFNNVNKQKSRFETADKENRAASKTVSPFTAENLNSGMLEVRSRRKYSTNKQLIIDAGQKRFGATQCSMCGMVYSASHPEDEHDHAAFHRRFLTFVKFSGWKNERVVASSMDGRIIKITSADPKYAMKKVADMLTIVDIDLGFKTPSFGLSSSKMAYFFISDSDKIVGCLVAEQISQAHRLILDTNEDTLQSGNVLCFTENTPSPALCGISRIWSYAPMRRKGIATRLVNALRDSFVLGAKLDKNQVAFSDPTPDGRAFATKYFETPNILVYNFLR